MKHAVIAKGMLAMLTALVLFCIVAAVAVQNCYYDAQQSNMRELLTAVSRLDGAGYDAEIAAITQREADISAAVLSSSGAHVLAGRFSGEFTAPEIHAAQLNGYGADIRSEGLDVHVYAAIRLADGNLLWAERPVATQRWIWALVLFATALLAASFIYFLCCSYLFENRLLRPFQSAVADFRDAGEGSYTPSSDLVPYAEFEPPVAELRAIAEQLSHSMRSLTAERDSIGQIFNNMSEGLAVLDRDLRILLINKSAAAYFGVGDEVKGRNLLHMTHLPKPVEAAREAVLNDRHEVFDIAGVDGRTLQIFISPVHGAGMDAEGGAIMLITDVTALRRAEQIRSDFVANVSHELKTPLTSIKGFTELMETGIVSDPDQVSRYLGLIRVEAERMIGLINDILRLSELESVVSDTGRVTVSLKLLAQRVAESLTLQAQERQVDISVSGAAGMLDANPDRMTELVLNLTDNAVKYNVPGGRVDVKIEEEPEKVVLTVSDTGVGIPPEAQERVFERFYRVDKGRSRRQGGTGLGLAIVKHIVSLYRGEIRLKSTPGTGTEIRVTLPVKQA